MARGSSLGEAQQKNQEVLNLLASVLSSMDDGVIVYDLDERIIMINEAALRIHELPNAAACLGKTYAEFIQPYHVRNERGEELPLEEHPARHVLTQKATSMPNQEHIIIELPSSKRLHLEIIGTRLQNTEKQIFGRVSVIRDVTKCWKNIDELQQNLNTLLKVVEELTIAARLRQTFDDKRLFQPTFLTHSGKHLTNLIMEAMHCKYVSIIMVYPDERLKLLGVSGLSKEQEHHFCHEIDHAHLENYFSQEERNHLYANETIMRDLYRNPYPYEYSNIGDRYRLITPMLLGNQLMGLFTIARADLEQIATREETVLTTAIARLVALFIEYMQVVKKWAEAHANEIALQETGHNFEVLLSLVSHELKTPLTTIQGNIQLALRRLAKIKPTLSEDAMKELERIQKPLEYASQRTIQQDQLILDLLDTTRIRENKLKYNMQPENLTEVVHATLIDAQMGTPERQFISQIVDKELRVLMDKNRIMQVINNYLANAVKYSGEDKPIIIVLKQNDGEARFEVKDQGPGIPVNEQQYIWERFYRVKNTEVQYGSNLSLGVGLYLCRTIIEHHGGRYGVESIPDQGSTFWFTLPLIDKDPAVTT